MNGEKFSRQNPEFGRRLSALQAGSPEAEDLRQEIEEELHDSLEKPRVAEEELRHQNEVLQAAR